MNEPWMPTPACRFFAVDTGVYNFKILDGENTKYLAVEFPKTEEGKQACIEYADRLNESSYVGKLEYEENES